MTEKAKGPWFNRMAIRLLTIALAVLIFWLLSFAVKDIKSISGPDYNAIEKHYVDPTLVSDENSIRQQIKALRREISNKSDDLASVGDSSSSFQRTINQLIELQKISIQKSISLPETDQQSLALSLQHFIASQKSYQDLSTAISQLVNEKRQLEDKKSAIEALIYQQQQPAQREFSTLNSAHRLKLAAYQLIILIPLLLIGIFLLIKKRDSQYFQLFLAFAVATLFKVTFVMHEYFPSKYFKYILIVVLLIAVSKFLLYLVNSVNSPDKDKRLKQYREAYERFLCPQCEYPIRIGPRKFLYWTRRTVNKIIPQAHQLAMEEEYCCPACGTGLFEKCASCEQIRYSLLSYCHHCKDEK